MKSYLTDFASALQPSYAPNTTRKIHSLPHFAFADGCRLFDPYFLHIPPLYGLCSSWYTAQQLADITLQATSQILPRKTIQHCHLHTTYGEFLTQAMYRRQARTNKQTPFPYIHDNLSEPKPRTEAPGTQAELSHRETIDLTIGSDTGGDASKKAVYENAPEALAHTKNRNAEVQPITTTACLQMVLSVFPDISVEHALHLIKQRSTDETRTTAQCEQIVAQLLDEGAYPKELDSARGKKRKREGSDSLSDYENGKVDSGISGYQADA